ncbi:Uncharacterised protein [Chlamydia trachomatis]|nr:Uncharacterised protein [Chlamydia trachomatis]
MPISIISIVSFLMTLINTPLQINKQPKILISLLLGHLSILEHPIARELDLGPSQLEVIPDV